MRITVVGAGPGVVGLVTAAGLAEMGHEVVLCDLDASRIGALRKGEVVLFEPRLKELLDKGVESGNLFLSDTVAAEGSEICFLTVDAPFDGQKCDTAPAFSAARAVAATLAGACVIAVKTAVPPGTCQALEADVRKTTTWHQVDVVANPEFLRSGWAVDDFFTPSRIVVGGNNPEAVATVVKVWEPLRCKILVVTSSRSAEVSKYACNLMLAARISMLNELAEFCEKSEADIDFVRQVMIRDPRIGPRYLFAGVGFGGGDLPKDVECYLAESYRLGMQANMARAILGRNRAQLRHAVQWVERHPGFLRIALWGLAYKGGVDDVRLSAGLVIASELCMLGHDVVVTDVEGMAASRREIGLMGLNVKFNADFYAAAEGADLLMVLTDWPAYREVDWKRLAEMMKGRSVYDGRNLYDPEAVKAAGFSYQGVGRGAVAK